jgi:two-component system OmpR family sensor kinase
MVVAIATLAGIALVVADVAGLSLLRSYLLNRLDHQLTTSAYGFARPHGGPPPPLPGPRPAFMRNPDTDLRVYVYDGTGTLTGTGGDATGTGKPATLGPYPSIRAHAGAAPYTVDISGQGSWRVVVAQRPDGDTVAVALSLGQVTATADRLLAIDVAVSLLVLLLLASAAASVVRMGLAPLTEMETTAQQIAAGDLSRRITDVDPHTEAGRLGLALNGMLARIQGALHDRTASEQRLRQFLADASHELRTPLTSIQGFAELYRRGGARPGPELDEAMGRIEAEAARMAVLVADLLMLARLDEERPLERHEVDLFAVAADTVRDAGVRAPLRHVCLEELAPAAPQAGPPAVHGDEARLRQVAANLVSNALAHTPPGTRIVVRVGRCAAGQLDGAVEPVAVGPLPTAHAPVAVLEVTDSGPGMAPEQAARVFERLFRADPSRQRGTGGAGLGLSIVAAIVTAHGGRVELRTAPGAGTAFRVLLPAVPVEVEFITAREILATNAEASLATNPTGTK